jgi:hypothetical protein
MREKIEKIKSGTYSPPKLKKMPVDTKKSGKGVKQIGCVPVNEEFEHGDICGI